MERGDDCTIAGLNADGIVEGQRVQLGVRRVIDTSCGQYVGCDHERGTEDRRGHRRQSGGQAGRRPCRLPDRSLPSVRPGRRDNTNRDRRRLYERGLSTFEAAAVGVGNEAAGRASGRRTPRRVGRRGRRLTVPCRPQRADGGTWPAPRPPSAVPRRVHRRASVSSWPCFGSESRPRDADAEQAGPIRERRFGEVSDKGVMRPPQTRLDARTTVSARVASAASPRRRSASPLARSLLFALPLPVRRHPLRNRLTLLRGLLAAFAFRRRLARCRLWSRRASRSLGLPPPLASGCYRCQLRDRFLRATRERCQRSVKRLDVVPHFVEQRRNLSLPGRQALRDDFTDLLRHVVHGGQVTFVRAPCQSLVP